MYEWRYLYLFYGQLFYIEKLGVYHESRPQTPKLEVSDRVRRSFVNIFGIYIEKLGVVINNILLPSYEI